jgi:hypothetical protein
MKLQLNTRRRGDENPHQHESDPEHSNINLGISSEARASAQARASHSGRHTYHQRARDLGAAISLRQARRINLEESNEEAVTEALPRYDRDAPRPPSYENCTCTSPNSLFRGESNLGSECRMRTVTEPRVVEGAWRDEASLESGSDDVYELRTSYGDSDMRSGLVLPPSY